MAKKKEKQKAKPQTEDRTKKETKPSASDAKEAILPQNIIQMGEHDEENKKIYISQSVYKKIRQFTKSKTQVESGGILVGETIEGFGKTNIIIRGFIEAKHSEGTPTTLKFTHETWKYVHEQMDKRFQDMKIVGWIHTHPNFGIFLSEYDKFIQGNFFSDQNQIAYVVDPIQNTEGFFFWKNNEIERCKGFFIFDDVDVEIDILQEEQTNQSQQQAAPAQRCAAEDWKLWLLFAAVAVLILLNAVLFGQIKALKTQQEFLKQNLAFLYSRQSFPFYQEQLDGYNALTDATQDVTAETEAGIPVGEPTTDATMQTSETEPSVSTQTDSPEETGHN